MKKLYTFLLLLLLLKAYAFEEPTDVNPYIISSGLTSGIFDFCFSTDYIFEFVRGFNILPKRKHSDYKTELILAKKCSLITMQQFETKQTGRCFGYINVQNNYVCTEQRPTYIKKGTALFAIIKAVSVYDNFGTWHERIYIIAHAEIMPTGLVTW